MKCQNCNNEFSIDEQDKAFYNRISVPEPTWCPECRFQRRLIFRNERALYKRKCDLCGKDKISIYDSNSPFKVYCSDCWYSDNWDPLKYGRDYDFNKPLFEQFKELQKNTPRMALVIIKNTNCEYVNYTAECKNCYLTVSAIWNENCYYGYRIFSSHDCFECYDIKKCENCYSCIQCKQSYNSLFCSLSESLVDCYLCYDCRNCSHCFGCAGLRNKKYHIFNKSCIKEEYEEKIGNISSYSNLLKSIEKAKQAWSKLPKRACRIINSKRCTGDEVFSSKNCINCFNIKQCEDMKNCMFSSKSKYCVDSCFPDNSEVIYETMSVEQDYNYILGTQCWYSHDITYSDLCSSSSNLFACIGLRNKEYCILNKQYTKEEYESLVPKIKKHMMDMPYTDNMGRTYKYGEFFTPELSPFGYNETVAQEHLPLTKEKALEQGFKWKDEEQKHVQSSITELPDNIKDVDDSILKQVIECEHKGTCNEQCTTAFRIIPQELEFYKKHNLALPRLCPNCRHFQRMKQINPFKLWKAKCNNCNKDIQTAYDPSKSEIVYCEDCYKKEIS